MIGLCLHLLPAIHTMISIELNKWHSTFQHCVQCMQIYLSRILPLKMQWDMGCLVTLCHKSFIRVWPFYLWVTGGAGMASSITHIRCTITPSQLITQNLSVNVCPQVTGYHFEIYMDVLAWLAALLGKIVDHMWTQFLACLKCDMLCL